MPLSLWRSLLSACPGQEPRSASPIYPYSARWYKWALYDRDPVERWSKGRVTLLGDSAHAMLPYLGQGAAMAIEDACVLSAAIARHADDPDKALLAINAYLALLKCRLASRAYPGRIEEVKALRERYEVTEPERP